MSLDAGRQTDSGGERDVSELDPLGRVRANRRGRAVLPWLGWLLAATVLGCVLVLGWLGWQDTILMGRTEALQAGRFGVWEVAQLQRQLLRLQGVVDVVEATGHVADAEGLRREMDLVLSRVHVLTNSPPRPDEEVHTGRDTILPRIVALVERVSGSLDAVIADPPHAVLAVMMDVDAAVRLSQEFFAIYFNEQNKRAARTTLALEGIRRNRTVLNAVAGVLIVLLIVVIWTWFRGRLQTMADLLEEREAGERRMRHLMAVSLQGILIHRDFELLYVNDALARLMGYPEADAAPSGASVLRFVHPEDRGFVVARYPERMAGAPLSDVAEVRLVTQDGTLLWVELRSRRIEWDGAPAALVTVLDVTERKASEMALRRAKEAAEAASRAKSNFLASMSHELRTPLTSILGFTQLILKELYGPLPEGARHALEDVAESGEHLLSLVNDVLDLSRIEAERLKLELAEWPADAAVQAVARRMRPLATEKGLQLHLDVAEGLPHCRCDLRRLTQILLNLVGNAVKFTDQGSIRIQVRRQAEELCYSVTDTGVGVSEEQRETLFEEFQQVDSTIARGVPGAGLGLAITKRLVELHGGRIWVESPSGGGSTFGFALPLGDADDRGANSERGRQPGPETDAPPVP